MKDDVILTGSEILMPEGIPSNIITYIRDLPPMPQIVDKIIRIADNPRSNANDLCQTLEADPALASMVLRIANSAMFSRRREITTLKQATMIIGYKAIKSLVVSTTLKKQATHQNAQIAQMLWENSLATAICSNKVALYLDKEYYDEAFVLGLLHSLGQFILLSSKNLTTSYSSVIKVIQNEGLTYNDAEQKVFGFTSNVIAALAAQKWHYSLEFCQILQKCQEPIISLMPENEVEEKRIIIQLANKLMLNAGIGRPENYPTTSHSESEHLAHYAGFQTEQIQIVLNDITSESTEQFELEKGLYI